MLRVFLIFLLPLAVFSTTSDVTFNNVEFKGYIVKNGEFKGFYSEYTLKFTKKINISNSLKENVPEEPYDHLEFLNQYIPVLRENSISDLVNLDKLTIENCELREIQPGAFRNLPLLRQLNLRWNNLEGIKSGVFNHLPLLMLDLSANRIKDIEATALDNLAKLQKINLANNYITAWNERWFQNTSFLTDVNMINNSLEKIPTEAFTNLKGNKTYGAVKLTFSLIFSENKIRKIEDGAFKGLKNIDDLWLDSNQLTEFGDNLLEDVDVQRLRLENNQLSCLTEKAIKAQKTYVDGNPFDCECMDKVNQWAGDRKKRVEMYHIQMKCMEEDMRRLLGDDWKRRLKQI